MVPPFSPKDRTRLKITDTLLRLERGGEELILTDYVNLRPLYVGQGRDYVTRFLKAAATLKTRRKIIMAFPRDVNLLDTLLNHGIIVPDGSPSAGPLNYSFEGPDFHNKRSVTLYLLISQACNMGCTYCLNGRKTYQTDRILNMDKAMAFKSVETCLENVAAGGRLEIIFFGGEPLLNWPVAKETITYCEESLRKKHPDKKIVYQFTSNLSFLPEDLIEWARRFQIAFLCDVDGPADIHDTCRPFKDGSPSHEAIAGNIRRLADAGLRVELRATVTSRNHDRLPEIAEHHRALGGRACAFVPVNPVNSDEDILPEEVLPSPRKMIEGLTCLYERKIWPEGDLYPFNQYAARIRPGSGTVLGCGVPCGNTVIVDVNGDAYPCIYLVGIRKFHLGNIMHGDYPNKKLLKHLYDSLHVDRLEDCRNCSWRYLCGGGCPLWRLTVVDNPRASGSIIDYCRGISCEYTRRIIELLLWDKARESASSLMHNLDGNETERPSNVLCHR